MKLNVRTKRLYTNDGRFLKTLSCPKRVRLADLHPQKDGHFSCSGCAEKILETAGLPDAELEQLLQKNPQQCLKLNLQQDNLELLWSETSSS